MGIVIVGGVLLFFFSAGMAIYHGQFVPRSNAERDGGWSILRPTKAYLYSGICFGLLAILSLSNVVEILTNQSSEIWSRATVFGLITLVFAIFTFWTLSNYWGYRVMYNYEEFRLSRYGRIESQHRWSELTDTKTTTDMVYWTKNNSFRFNALPVVKRVLCFGDDEVAIPDTLIGWDDFNIFVSIK